MLPDPFRSYGPPQYKLPVFGVRGTEEEEVESGVGNRSSLLVSVLREKVPFAIFNSTTASGTPQY